MRQLLQISFLMVFLFTLPLSHAAGDIKLGVVNVALLLEKAPQAKSATGLLEKEFSPQQAELKSLAAQLEKKQSAYQKNKAVMSETQKVAKEREISMMTREIQRRRSDIQELLNLRRNEELAKLQNIVNQAIKKIGKKEAFDLILYEGIAYTNGNVDITPKVLQYLEDMNNKRRNDFNK